MNERNFLSVSIPKDWKNIRLKYNDKVIMGQSPSSEDYSLNPEDQPFLQGNAEFQDIHPTAKLWCNSAKKLCKQNDILLSVRAPIGAINIADREYGIGRGLCSVRSQRTYRNYLYYLLVTSNEYFNNLGTGSTYTAITVDDVRNLSIPLPPLKTQKQIANFLDKETTRIDTLISKKQKQIELLQEKRQAIITQSVTKGLNPNVKMKDSGVQWIGEIPAHWDLRKLRYIGTCQNGISKGGEYFGFGYPFVSYGDVYNNLILPEKVKGLVDSSDSERTNCSVKEGDIFFTRTSETIEEIGIVSTCLNTIPDAVFAGFLIRVRTKKGLLDNNYSKYYFGSDIHRKYFVKEMNIVTRASLGQELLKNLTVLLPPHNEMQEIGNYLDKQVEVNTQTIEKVESSINLLKEYRSSLITHAVSGQIDISEYGVSK